MKYSCYKNAKYLHKSKTRSIILKGSVYQENSFTVALSWMKGGILHTVKERFMKHYPS